MKDILLSEDYDVKITNGDFSIDNSQQQEIELILLSHKGAWKQYPHIGVGITSQINGVVDNIFLQKVRLNLEADDFKVKSVKYDDYKLKIEANK